MWTDKNRAKYDRDHLRYPSDLTDDVDRPACSWALDHVRELAVAAPRPACACPLGSYSPAGGLLPTECRWRHAASAETAGLI
jgi:hypothetical protein